jgi:hypothetical protein
LHPHLFEEACRQAEQALNIPATINGQEQATYLDWMRSCFLVTVTGCPAISVPAGFTREGWPVGIQIVAAPRNERLLLEVAHAFEQLTARAELAVLSVGCGQPTHGEGQPENGGGALVENGHGSLFSSRLGRCCGSPEYHGRAARPAR